MNNHLHNILGTLQALQGLSLNDVQQAQLLQKMGMAPQEQQADLAYKGSETTKNQAQAGLMQQQSAVYPAEHQADTEAKNAAAFGAVGHGLAYSPELSADVLPQLAQRLKLYTPDPNAALARKATQYKMSPQQLQQLQQKLPQPKVANVH